MNLKKFTLLPQENIIEISQRLTAYEPMIAIAQKAKALAEGEYADLIAQYHAAEKKEDYIIKFH